MRRELRTASLRVTFASCCWLCLYNYFHIRRGRLQRKDTRRTRRQQLLKLPWSLKRRLISWIFQRFPHLQKITLVDSAIQLIRLEFHKMFWSNQPFGFSNLPAVQASDAYNIIIHINSFRILSHNLNFKN